ncbi:MAG: hypothetical protein P4L43_02625 [Syntrophobacteraceae bacterium]|nr:hypothetical protein [Syntrophobacteraceae bacterium]
MEKYQRASILFELIESLRKQGSWCGETHVQKAAYFLEALCGVPLHVGFILYKHGPFSFELRDELTELRADGLLVLQPQPPYGPRLNITIPGKTLKDRFPKTLDKYRSCISLVAEKFGQKGVSELECLATALYVTKTSQLPGSIMNRAKELNAAKPHIDLTVAQNAIEEIDIMLKAV